MALCRNSGEGKMKWRPISELSNEQRDGRWWVFGSFNWTTELKRDENISFTAKCINEYRYCQGFCSWINDEGELLEDVHDIPHGDFFLSEPLPDLPKPQKMEWRRLEEEWPLNFPIICRLLNRENILIEETYTFEANRKIISYWMPIMPPENE